MTTKLEKMLWCKKNHTEPVYKMSRHEKICAFLDMRGESLLNGFYRKTLSQGFRNFFYRKKAQGVVADESPFFIAKFFFEKWRKVFPRDFRNSFVKKARDFRKNDYCECFCLAKNRGLCHKFLSKKNRKNLSQGFRDFFYRKQTRGFLKSFVAKLYRKNFLRISFQIVSAISSLSSVASSSMIFISRRDLNSSIVFL